MAEEKKVKSKKLRRKNRKVKDKKKSLKELKIAYRSLEDTKKFYKTILFPLIVIGILVFCMPFILQIIIPVPLELNPIMFIIGGIVPIFLGIFYPYISWKNKESDINGKMHFYITHIRVLAISDTSLKDIIGMLGGNKAYGSLGEELRKISVLSDQWRVPLSRSFMFISKRTPSKILRDFLDRFSQSLDSGVEHREFIETEQDAVLEEYKTMYESANENITILNEVYVSLLIAIIFVMALGIVLPMIIGAEDMNTFIFLSSFLLIVSEGLLLYLLRAMVPADEIWHLTGEKGKLELGLEKLFKISVLACILVGSILFFGKYSLKIPMLEMFPFEIVVAALLTPLIIPGVKVLKAEEDISRKEKNFLGFLPSLGSIATMRGGKINASVYYLSEKDYGVLTKHIRDLYRRLRTRISDNDSWEWFGIDTGSNYIQRSCEMFRQSTAAAANPRRVSRMISENIRKIRDLRIKKLTIVNTTAALFGGITFGIAFSVYTSLVIARHLNTILIEGMGGDPFAGTTIDVGAILSTVPPEVFTNNFIIVFIVLVIHCFMLAITIRTLKGSHMLMTLFYFVPFVWVVAITGAFIDISLGGYLGM
ncbi:MAG: archaellar assembly protein FlaJ [Thermoplasmatales archaeon]|nr:MAG: archaellar assembly protein FlaJ [Thermoplasmatales archaeon]